MDKSYWKDPESFRPERFITPEGKIRRDERLVPFGKGKRACMGESLARSSSFALLAAMIQRYSFSFDPNLPIPETEGVPGFTMAAPFFQIIATPRN
ncbi:UNVERIFIED_CONTAM: hypothetical protein GTU68_019868 [Idotea baltica]|nr:hypothetical protein [Idotea baltica]